MTNSLSRHSSQPPEDWDHPEQPTIDRSTLNSSTAAPPAPSRVAFPTHGGGDGDGASCGATPDAPPSHPHPHRGDRAAGKRTLSDLLKLHAEKGTDVHFTAEEAARLEETLGRWVRVVCRVIIKSLSLFYYLCFSRGPPFPSASAPFHPFFFLLFFFFFFFFFFLFFFFFFFFFSSRRRHTRSDRDWSSDVCSSDLFAS